MRLFFLISLLPLGCATTPPRNPSDGISSCGRRIEAADYCGNFDATEVLRQNPSAQRVKVHCLHFFREAVRSTHLLCSYFEELDSLTYWGEGEGSAFLAAKGKQIHRNFAARAQRAAEELERVYVASGGRGSQGAVEELSFEGRQSLEGELDCRESQNPASGFLLLGLAAQTRRDQKATYDSLTSALGLLSGATSLKLERPLLALRTAMNLKPGEEVYGYLRSRIVSKPLDEPSLLAVGKAEVPSTPRLEKVYARAEARALAPKDRAAVIREESTGRSLASVRCER